MKIRQKIKIGMKDRYVSGFTLVETLIAIAILMVAVAGPLTIANQALTAALGSRNAMIATYLAQDGMETIRNIKDNYSVKPTTFSVFDSATVALCTSTDSCEIPKWLAGSAQLRKCSNGCRLYTDPDENYNYAAGTLTPFKRFFFLQKFTNGSINEVVVTVIVSWSDGSVPNQIQLQELMTDAPR